MILHMEHLIVKNLTEIHNGLYNIMIQAWEVSNRHVLIKL